jgi:succinoglycan biosynthesis protein ExoM
MAAAEPRADTTDRIEVSICCCTFRRPAGLARLIQSLRSLDPESPSHEVIVVDNDAEASAQPVVEAARMEGMHVKYAVEPARGIARARNRSLELATGEYVAFIDDDEEAAPRWLLELWREVVRSGAEGGVGPVLPAFSADAPRWLVEGGFFERGRLPTGTPLKAEWTRMGNALVERGPLIALSGPFDERYNFTGGEDGDVFARLIGAGCRFVAVDSAIVLEHLTPNRTTMRALLKRRVRTGIDQSRLAAAGAPPRWGPLGSAVASARALKEGLIGLLLLPVARASGLRRLLLSARHIGHVMFLNGLSCHPYLNDSWR